MSGVITAIVAGAVLTAGATVYSSKQSSKATNSATNAAISGQQGALAQQAALSQPYRDIATGGDSGTGGAIAQYQALLGLGPSGGAGIQQTLQNTPGYQFTKQQGNQATLAGAGAMGLGLSGNTLQALDQYNSGLADSTYQTVLGNSLNAVQLGQAAAAGQAANIGNAANNISSLTMNQGNINAGIAANEAASLAKIGGNAANSFLTYNTLQHLNNQPSIAPQIPQDPGTVTGGGDIVPG